jgi:FkbM family methyltransferase
MRWLQRLRPKTKVADGFHTVGGYALRLPAEHALPGYQRSHRLYDRLLASFAPEPFDGWIIDIGANVGDSVAALASGPPKKFLCVEPVPTFFSYLSLNAQTIESDGSLLYLVNKAISGHMGTVILAEGAGTARQGDVGVEAVSVTLDDLVSEVCGSEPVSFIKCDVDGHDADALLSGSQTIERHRPIVFFECDVQKKADERGYFELVRFLKRAGYRFACFDNFGLPIFDTSEMETVEQVITYITRLKEQKSTRTFYYVDVLAYQEDHSFVQRALERYSDTVDVA